MGPGAGEGAGLGPFLTSLEGNTDLASSVAEPAFRETACRIGFPSKTTRGKRFLR